MDEATKNPLCLKSNITAKETAMRATRFNHVSVRAADLEMSVKWYEDMFGVTRIPAPNFGFNVGWLKLGDMQLHVFEYDCASNQFSHFGIDVDDFEAIYLRAKAQGCLANDAFNKHHLFETPTGQLQLYIRDPAGNLIEVNWPDATTVDRTVVKDIRRLADIHAQNEENRRALLYVQSDKNQQ
jgi:catechol 2,3-dioxygenase-like lactoylglutathione lyase family enzyme